MDGNAGDCVEGCIPVEKLWTVFNVGWNGGD
jgi:hypothetical protein